MIKLTKVSVKKIAINTGIYLLVFIGGYFLYNSKNKHPQNTPHTDFSFIYAQF